MRQQAADASRYTPHRARNDPQHVCPQPTHAQHSSLITFAIQPSPKQNPTSTRGQPPSQHDPNQTLCPGAPQQETPTFTDATRPRTKRQPHNPNHPNHNSAQHPTNPHRTPSHPTPAPPTSPRRRPPSRRTRIPRRPDPYRDGGPSAPLSMRTARSSLQSCAQQARERTGASGSSRGCPRPV
jgi:hypothetical protein